MSRKGKLGRIFDEDGKMKTQTKTTLLSAIIISVGLFSATSFAIPEVSSSSDEYASNNDNFSSTSINYSYAYPSVTSEIFETKSQLNLAAATQVSAKPFLDIKVVDFSLLTSNKIQRKNSIFEFAAKFNDKLQQILAFFSFSENNHLSKVAKDLHGERDLRQITIKQKTTGKRFQTNCNAVKA